MLEQSPLAQAEARIVVLEAKYTEVLVELATTRKSLVEAMLTLGTLDYQAQRLMKELRREA